MSASDLLAQSRVDPIFGDHDFHRRIERFLKDNPDRPQRPHRSGEQRIELAPDLTSLGKLSLLEALKNRRSVREWSDDGLDLPSVALFLTAIYGPTAESRRATPSAGGFWSLNLSLWAKRARGFEPGLYLYDPGGSALHRPSDEPADVEALDEAAPGLKSFGNFPGALFVTAELGSIDQKYGARGSRFVLAEYGAVLQNAHLVAAALGWGVCAYGGGYDGPLESLLNVSSGELFVGAFVFGRPSRQ